MSETSKISKIDISSIDPEKDRIPISQIEKEDSQGKQMNTLIKTGYNLALIVIAYIFVVTFALLVDYSNHAPATPNLVAQDSSGINISILEGYERLSEISTERSLKLFDQLIHKTFLPVLTAILGYIFGIRGVEKQEEES